jgi:hypothetical protein
MPCWKHGESKIRAKPGSGLKKTTFQINKKRQPKRTAWTGLPVKDRSEALIKSQDNTARTGLPGQNFHQSMTTVVGQETLYIKTRAVKKGQDSQDRAARTGQIEHDNYGGQDSHDLYVQV